jgi:hypothetical protein
MVEDTEFKTAYVRELHDSAMVCCDYARQYWYHKSAHETWLSLALEREMAAARAVPVENEPTRSVLHRSAATIALQLGHYRTARELAQRGLNGDPPHEIQVELRDVLHKATERAGNK